MGSDKDKVLKEAVELATKAGIEANRLGE